MNYPKVFMSYSYLDKEFATKIANDLKKAEIDIWNDKWEIQEGDSLIYKIISEGIANSDFFLILLSNASVNSKWVKEELDAAIIQNIESITHIIPILIEPIDIPLPLRNLIWIEMYSNYDNAIKSLIKIIHEDYENYSLNIISKYFISSIGGLSKNASSVGSILLLRPDDKTGFEKSFSAKELQSLVPLTSQELNDAINELEEYGLVKTLNYLGTAPYDFGQVTPTYMLFIHFKEKLDYDPYDDIKSIAEAIIKNDQKIDLKIPPVRINRAVAYLEAYGYIKVIRTLGTAPYDFGILIPTEHIHDFV
ncbi:MULTISPECIES: toll/interleukin-1 receptor domain-containing protein [Methanobacterium]|uniref:Toll/interleukin-1 receptor domain-containing protein n=1 Tax=Methanobacterium veterum TaxID=408577 RepID=A0A9E5A670_9EURY|nr:MULTISPECIES: toll/interleukin-1 receptor domain-containing protein [Methanobacterium]MCZ3364407.1 toll/interleukin-1 receptor domain-containing protein [Methanobacterium veterum]MCZ3372158.1 toll/interleukin-1 receptor domain-containing protein [Methanobacterium veterum]